MKKLTFSISAAAVALTGAAGIAYAAPGIWNGGEDVTRAQAQTQAAERFAKIDVNSDGVLNQADREARHAQRFQRMDANNDGAISRDEFTARPARGERGDGEMRERRGGKHHGMRGGRHGGRGMTKMADANGDGAISQAEFTAGALKMFDAADADNNGTVTAAERKAAHEAMREQRRARRAAQTAQ